MTDGLRFAFAAGWLLGTLLIPAPAAAAMLEDTITHELELATTYPPTDTLNDWVGPVHAHFDEADWSRALNVIGCESGYKHDADNPFSTARGGWQMLKGTWAWVQTEIPGLDDYPTGPDDPDQATQAAAWLVYEGGGWSHWNPSKSCWAGAPAIETGTTDLVSDGTPAR